MSEQTCKVVALMGGPHDGMKLSAEMAGGAHSVWADAATIRTVDGGAYLVDAEREVATYEAER